MDELLKWMDYIEDKSQQKKVRHKLKDIIVIVLFAAPANVDDWVEMEYFAHYHEAYLKKYIELKNGIPSHDTLCRVFGMLSPEILQQLYGKWQELLNQNEGEALRKLICMDGKTMRSNKRMEEKTIQKDGQEKKEFRYYIGSLNEDIELFSRAVRGHWSVESMHWQLDVTFKEDARTTLDKQAAENLNIVRKWCLSILKMAEIFRPNLSMKKKRFVISMNPAEFLEQVLNF